MYSEELKSKMQVDSTYFNMTCGIMKYIEENLDKLKKNIPTDYNIELDSEGAINNIDLEVGNDGKQIVIRTYNIFSRLIVMYNFKEYLEDF